MESEFYVQINFQRETENPERVFQAMTDLIHTFRHIDQDLSSSIASNIKSKLILQDIETGSVRARLKSLLESVDDDSLKSLDWKKILGSYLVKGKHSILKFLEDKDKIESRKQVEDLRQSLIFLAKETDVKLLPFYTPITESRLLKDLQHLGTAMTPLIEKDIVIYGSSTFQVG